MNRDDRSWQRFSEASHAEVLTYGIRSRTADLRATDVLPWPDSSTFSLVTDEWEIDASVPLPGEFNVLNATAAIAVAAALGLDPMAAAAGVARSPGVPGRMQPVEGAPFPVIVDYAHTPDAMRQVLAQLTPLVEGRVIVVFGCAGERSPERRTGLGPSSPKQGAARLRRAHRGRPALRGPRRHPRGDRHRHARRRRHRGPPESRRRHSRNFERVPDRRAAIARALALATPADLVLLAGKGHESTIERADASIPWNEARSPAPSSKPASLPCSLRRGSRSAPAPPSAPAPYGSP